MSTAELRNRIIEKIKKTKNEKILKEESRLLDLENGDIEVYKFNGAQKKAVNEQREQIKNGQLLKEEAANKEIDEWLNK